MTLWKGVIDHFFSFLLCLVCDTVEGSNRPFPFLLCLVRYAMEGSNRPFSFLHCLVCDAVEADIQFLLDASGSVGSVDFSKVKDFVRRFAQHFNIGPGSVNIGVVTFDSTPHNEFWLNQHTDRPSLLAAIDQIQYSGGTTFTADALQFIRENSFTPVRARSASHCLFVRLYLSVYLSV